MSNRPAGEYICKGCNTLKMFPANTWRCNECRRADYHANNRLVAITARRHKLRKFSTAVRMARRKLKLSQLDVANITGLHVNTVSRIESGKSDAERCNCSAIVQALNLPISTMMLPP